jgi:hypothetical protein
MSLLSHCRPSSNRPSPWPELIRSANLSVGKKHDEHGQDLLTMQQNSEKNETFRFSVRMLRNCTRQACSVVLHQLHVRL